MPHNYCSANDEITENWRGNNVLACRGKVFMGPAYYAAIITFLAITFPYIVFLAFPIYVMYTSHQAIVFFSQMDLVLHGLSNCPHYSLRRDVSTNRNV